VSLWIWEEEGGGRDFFLLLGAFSKSFLKAVLFILNFGQTAHHNKSNAPA
jgi:hypothetical protein